MTSTSFGRRANRGRLTPLASALALTLFTGLTASASASFNPMVDIAARLPAAASANVVLPGPAGDIAYYTIVFKTAPLATYAGDVAGLPAPGQVTGRSGISKLDVESPAALAYVDYLRNRQDAFVAEIGASYGRPLVVMARMQHAINAVIVGLSGSEASAIARRPDVDFIEREHELELHTDHGPAYIGAPAIWNGLTGTGIASKGEGMVIGVIDTGVNWQSPAFAATGPIDGYVHQNPRGTGNYLGLCQAGFADVGRCNDKLIGMYNFASTAADRSGQDTQGHGSHTASTTAGNQWQATYASGQFTISGVAPHANIITYLACPSTCPTTATTQAANQAVIDGVDVINYSISGGTSPWTDTTSTAFRNANAAGVFVATSAGNTSTTVPNPQGQVNHLEPWTETVAASTQDRIIAVSLDLADNGAPANTQNVPMRPGGAPLPTANLTRVPIIKSPNFNIAGNADGCSPYPADTFTRAYVAPEVPADRIFADDFDPKVVPPERVGAIAVLSLDAASTSPCASGARRTAALAAGAVGVIYVDDTYLNLGASGTSWAMLTSDWNVLEAAIAPATSTVSIDIAAQAFPSTNNDVIADFSFRGPRLIGGQGIMKPGISAPGVDILAVGAANVVGQQGVYLNNGTSMASPHIAGAAALMRAINPTWSPSQVKSAMNLTARNTGGRNPDGSPARPWDFGSGFANLAAASKVGLVLDETAANYLAANPATGGNISSLNLASITRNNIIGSATFTRTFRRARSGTQTYTISTSGLAAGAVEFTPTTFTLNSSGSRAVTVTINSQFLTEATWNFGSLTLTPSSGDEPVLNLPIAAYPGGPAIAVNPTSLSGSSDTTVSNDLAISNTANPTLNWTLQTTGTGQITPFNTTTTTNGWSAGYYIANSQGNYWSQNFDVSASMRVTTLRANGFTLPNTVLTATNTPEVAFRIYADNAGSPAGAPEGFGAAPIWEFAGAISTANGITTTGGALALNLDAANVVATPLNLAPGRYWMTVTPRMNGNGGNTAGNPLWAWYVSGDAPVGNVPKLYAPWDDATQFQTAAGLNMLSALVQGTVDCTLPTWASTTTTSGSLGFGGSQTIPVTFDATGLAANTYRGTLCIASNATNLPVVPVPLTFTVPNGGAQPPTLAKAFAPASVNTGVTSTLTITLGNPGPTVATLSSALTDTFPSGLVVAATPNAATTCGAGTVTANAGDGSVSLASGATIAAAGSCTVSVDVTSATAGAYANVLAAGALQTSAGNNAAAATSTLTVTTPPLVAPTLTKAFAPASVSAGTVSVLTLTLANPNPSALTLSAALTDPLPAGMLVAPTPGAATTCTSGAVTATAGATSVTLASGAQIPAAGNCTVTVNVRAVSAGTFANTIVAGALQTNGGNNADPATASLAVTAGTFPAPYCARPFANAVEPITLVNFGSINNATAAAVGGTALENFLAQSATLRSGSSYVLTVKGNSDGNFANFYRAYFDWNQDGVFSENASERFELGTITNSTGLDALQTAAAITVPAGATVGTTRMRIVKKYLSAGSACGGDDAANSSYGQAEDYTIVIDPTATAPAPIPTATLAFSPSVGSIASPPTLTISLGQLNGVATINTTAVLTQTLPTGLTVAATPNAATTCPSGVVTATAAGTTISLASGAQIPVAGCTVSASVQAANAGVFNATLAAGALQTDAGNSVSAAAASYRGLAANQPTYSTGFESPFTVGALGTQQGWGTTGSAAASTISAASPAVGAQHLRVTSTALAAAATLGAISPTQAVGTSAYSTLSAKVRISQTGAGATFELNPQDPLANVVSTLLRFDRSAGRNIQMPNFATGVYVNTGASWPLATYFNVLLQFNRAAGTVEACINGTSIYNGSGAVSSPYIANVIARQVGQAGNVAGNTMDVDDVVISNTDTAVVCTPPPPTVAKAFSPIAVAAGASSTLTITLGNPTAGAATLTAPLVDTFPTGLVVAATPNAATTCPSGTITAAAGAGSVTLGTGAQIPTAGCTVTVSVQSATEAVYANVIPSGGLQTSAGNSASAASANLLVGNAIFTSPAINHVLAATSDGTSINWTSGAIIDDDLVGYDINFWNSAGIQVFWSNAPAISAGVAPTTSSANLSVLTTGAVIGPASTWARTGGAMTAWRAGATGAFGFRFDCSSIGVSPTGVCYGYARMTTTSATGYPATLIDYAFDRTGAAITIP